MHALVPSSGLAEISTPPPSSIPLCPLLEAFVKMPAKKLNTPVPKGKAAPKGKAPSKPAVAGHRISAKSTPPAAPTPGSSSSDPKAEFRKQQSGFLMLLNKTKGGQSSERAGQAKRVLEEYQELETPEEKRQMIQDFYSAGGAKGKGLEVLRTQSISSSDRKKGGRWEGYLTPRGIATLWEVVLLACMHPCRRGHLSIWHAYGHPGSAGL